MHQTPKPRLNVVARSARTKRIFARLPDGWTYDEIAREERLTYERIRQIVSEAIGRRVIDRGSEHAHIQLERLMPALRLASEAVGRGEIKAIAPLLKVIDRLDKHQTTVVAKYTYGPEEREKLLAKLNRVAANLGYDKGQALPRDVIDSMYGGAARDEGEEASEAEETGPDVEEGVARRSPPEPATFFR
jgi:hypothetical protein